MNGFSDLFEFIYSKLVPKFSYLFIELYQFHFILFFQKRFDMIDIECIVSGKCQLYFLYFERG